VVPTTQREKIYYLFEFTSLINDKLLVECWGSMGIMHCAKEQDGEENKLKISS